MTTLHANLVTLHLQDHIIKELLVNQIAQTVISLTMEHGCVNGVDMDVFNANNQQNAKNV